MVSIFISPWFLWCGRNTHHLYMVLFFIFFCKMSVHILCQFPSCVVCCFTLHFESSRKEYLVLGTQGKKHSFGIVLLVLCSFWVLAFRIFVTSGKCLAMISSNTLSIPSSLSPSCRLMTHVQVLRLCLAMCASAYLSSR